MGTFSQVSVQDRHSILARKVYGCSHAVFNFVENGLINLISYTLSRSGLLFNDYVVGFWGINLDQTLKVDGLYLRR